jgi:hypothetical protein
VWFLSGCECEYKVRKGFRCGCMRGVGGVEDDEHATGLTSRPPPAWPSTWVVSSTPSCRPVFDRCMSAVRGEREGRAEVRRGSSAPGR